MKLSTKSRYAIMAMVDVACYGIGEPIALKQIAMRQNIALNYLEQIFLKLKRHGLVKSFKGPGGGYLLAYDISVINIADIMMAMNSEFHLTRCTEKNHGGCMPSNVKCMTHSLWDDLGKNILSYLRSISLADIINKKQTSGRRLDFSTTNVINDLLI